MRLLNHNLGPWRAQYSLKGPFKRTAQIWYLTLNNLPRYSALIPYTDYRLQTLTWLIPVKRKWGIRLRTQYSKPSFDHIPEENSAKFCCKSLVTWLLDHHRDILFPAEFSRYCSAMNAKIGDLRSVVHLFFFQNTIKGRRPNYRATICPEDRSYGSNGTPRVLYKQLKIHGAFPKPTVICVNVGQIFRPGTLYKTWRHYSSHFTKLTFQCFLIDFSSFKLAIFCYRLLYHPLRNQLPNNRAVIFVLSQPPLTRKRVSCGCFSAFLQTPYFHLI